MQIDTKLTIKNIDSIVGTILNIPNLDLEYRISYIEETDDEYQIDIQQNHAFKMRLYITRTANDSEWVQKTDTPIQHYTCTMRAGFSDKYKWVMNKKEFKDKNVFIHVVGRMVEKMVIEAALTEMGSARYTLSNSSNSTSVLVSPIKPTLHTPTDETEPPTLYTPEKPKPNLTHKIKKIMQGLGQIPDYILHNIQYYIRKIV